MTGFWADRHEEYRKAGWTSRSSLFAQTAMDYFPRKGTVLELGAGRGQDSRFFAEHGYQVTSTDFEESVLTAQRAELPEELSSMVSIRKADLREELPFSDNSFDVVYAHLSLHYFDHETTRRLLSEISRVLKVDGILAFLVNSEHDPELAEGIPLEDEFVQFGAITKRYFSLKKTREYIQYFDTILLDDKGESYKDNAVGVRNLIRFIGKKPEPKEFKLAIPTVGAILQREIGGEREVLLQTRWQPASDPLYSGTFEFPIGKLDKSFEDVFSALAREIFEETGLTLKRIIGDSRTKILSSGHDDEVIGFKPFCCVQQLKNGRPWIGFIFLCEVEPGEPRGQLSESKDVHWMRIQDVKELVENDPNKIFGLQLPAWQYFFANQH